MHYLVLEQFSLIKNELKSGHKIFEETIYLHRRHPAKNIVTFLTDSKIADADKQLIKSQFEVLESEKKVKTYIIGRKAMHNFIIRPFAWGNSSDKRIGQERNKEFKDLLVDLQIPDLDRKIVSLFAIFMHENQVGAMNEDEVDKLIAISRIKLDKDQITSCLDNFPLIINENGQYEFIAEYFKSYYVIAEVEQFERTNFIGAIHQEIGLFPNVDRFSVNFYDLQTAFRKMEEEKNHLIKDQKYEEASISYQKTRTWLNTVFMAKWNEMNESL